MSLVRDYKLVIYPLLPLALALLRLLLLAVLVGNYAERS